MIYDPETWQCIAFGFIILFLTFLFALFLLGLTVLIITIAEKLRRK